MTTRSGKPAVLPAGPLGEDICHPRPGGWGTGGWDLCLNALPTLPFTGEEADVPTTQQQCQGSCPRGQVAVVMDVPAATPPRVTHPAVGEPGSDPVCSLSGHSHSQRQVRVTLMPSERPTQGAPLSCVSEGSLGCPWPVLAGRNAGPPAARRLLPQAHSPRCPSALQTQARSR